MRSAYSAEKDPWNQGIDMVGLHRLHYMQSRVVRRGESGEGPEAKSYVYVIGSK